MENIEMSICEVNVSCPTEQLELPEAWLQLESGTRVQLLPGVNLLGRARHCRLRGWSKDLSREHAQVVMDPFHGTIYVEDLGSKNGTFLACGACGGGERTRVKQPMVLSNGDRLWLGSMKLRVIVNG